jgi:hypothetical protein
MPREEMKTIEVFGKRLQEETTPIHVKKVEGSGEIVIYIFAVADLHNQN